MRKFIAISLFLFVLSGLSHAQVHYPVRTNTTVNPPAPQTLDEFVSTPGKLNLQVIGDDISMEEHALKLRLSIEGNAIRIYT
ncbi:MAG: hypothetical protein R6U46_09365, partial [Marinilabilia sp.]